MGQNLVLNMNDNGYKVATLAENASRATTTRTLVAPLNQQ